MKKPKETDLVRACLSYLRTRGIIAWRTQAGVVRVENSRYVKMAEAGVSDIIGALPGGRILACECKLQGNKPSAEQRAFLDRITELGGCSVVAYTVDDLHEAIQMAIQQGECDG